MLKKLVYGLISFSFLLPPLVWDRIRGLPLYPVSGSSWSCLTKLFLSVLVDQVNLHFGVISKVHGD
uniref:Uncharacterized protein n=1 Tax=Utricularia reniformis TaxID=192314 RepID=A0A1Y0B4H8_9LAMI|nr:hypothetical protein AEK19_MT2220 [Utricularia reniformis]ART32366.1 hypothetical protein AEK19_MT2220 [Utricularia reniformis]